MARTPNRRPADDEDDEAERPAPKKRPVARDDDEEEEDEKPAPKKRPVVRNDDEEKDQRQKPKKKSAQRDDEDEDDDAPVKKKKGKLLYVFLGCGGLMLLLGIGTAAGIYVFVIKAKDAISKVTFPTDTSSPATKPPDVAKAPPIAVLKGHEGAVNGLAFSKDGNTLASVSQDKTLRFWNTKLGLENQQVPLTAGFGYGVVWTSEGNVVTTSGNGKDGGDLPGGILSRAPSAGRSA